jgi:hypothetical protein
MLQQLNKSGCPEAAPWLAYLVAQDAILKEKSWTDSTLRAFYERKIAYFEGTNNLYVNAFFNEKAGFAFTKQGPRRGGAVF